MMRVLGIVTAALIATLPATAQVVAEASLKERGAALNTAELQAFFTGKTAYHKNLKTGQNLPIYFDPSGMRYFKVGGAKVLSTAWSIADGKRCEETTAGPEVCMTVYKAGSDVYLCDPRYAGECLWQILRVADGDPEKLKVQP
jgi:hypothetical protein